MHTKNPCLPKTLVTACPKKGGNDAYPLSHEVEIQTVNSKTWTVCSKFVPSAPILNRDLQLSTVSSNSQSWAPIINCEVQFWTLCSTGPTPKFTKTSKLNWTVQNESRQCPNTLVIFYYILYRSYFYYILFYIICILFLLYVILYYINCHNSIFSLGIVFLT